MPPATAMSMSPSAIPWAASITAFNPDPQTLLMVRAATSRTAIAPSCGACSDFSEPRNFPEGVRTALTMTGVRISLDDDPRDGAGAEQADESSQDDRRR